MDSVTIVVPRVVPSRNLTRKWHFWELKSERDAWACDIYHLSRGLQKAWLLAKCSQKAKMRVEIEREGHKLLDPDNMDVKHIVDALRHIGFLYNDDPEHMELVVRQRKSNERQTTIKISCAKLTPLDQGGSEASLAQQEGSKP